MRRSNRLTTILLLGTLILPFAWAATGEANTRITNDPATSATPSAFVGDDGNVRIAWSDNRTGNYEIFWELRDRDGNHVTGPVQVTTSSAASTSPRLSVDGSNRSFLVWREGGFSGQVYFARLGPSGVVEVAPLRISDGSGTCERPDVATDPSGTSYVVFEHNTFLFRLRLVAVSENGAVVCSKVPGETDLFGISKYPTIDFKVSGSLEITWIDMDNYVTGLYRSEYNPVPGCQLVGKQRLRTGSIEWPALLANRLGSTWVLFELNDQIHKLGTPDVVISPPPGPSRRPRIAGSDGRPVVAVWEEWGTGTLRIGGGEWDGDGNYVDDNLGISVGAVGPDAPDVETNRNGLYYVVWSDQRDGNAEIYLEIIDRTGGQGKAKISGLVEDAFNRRGIGRVSVTATTVDGETEYSAETDRYGRFDVPVQPGAAYRVTMSHVGYTPPPAGTTGVVGEEQNYWLGTTLLSTKTVLLLHGVLSNSGTWTAESDGFSFARTLAESGSYYVDSTLTLVGSSQDWFGRNGGVYRQQQRLALHLSDLRNQGIQSVDVVAHSMGGLVSRLHLLNERPGQYSIRTLIMLGTPNHGSELANALSTAWLLFLARGCYVDPFFCAIKLFAGEYPQAVFDLSTGSSLLRTLNYGGAPAGGNSGCLPHSPVTTLNSETTYITYAGTTLPSASCAPPINAAAATVLAALTGCNNDGAVPVNSVRLDDAGGMAKLKNFHDSDCGCVSIHEDPKAESVCPKMTEDPCVVAAVHRALQGGDLCELGAGAADEEAPSVFEDMNLMFADGIALGPSDTTTMTGEAGFSDSLIIESNWWSGDLAMTLVDPSGRPITPDSSLSDPDIDYLGGPTSARYVIRNAPPGSWVVQLVNSAADSAWGMVGAFEYSSLSLVVQLDGTELVPGQPQRVEAALADGGLPILGATAGAAITLPDETVLSVAFADDGLNGDQMAGDGVYSGLVAGNALSGVYEVDVHATGTYGEGLSLNRLASVAYSVEERPDIALEEAGIYLFPDSVSTDSVVVVTVTLVNTGLQSADSVLVRFLEDATRTTFAETTLARVGPTEGVSVSANWPVGRTSARVRLGAQAYVLGGAVETNILNNQAFAELVVTGLPPDWGWEEGRDHGRQGGRVISLLRAVPNPSRGGTSIMYRLEEDSEVQLSLYDIVGRLVLATEPGFRPRGEHSYQWHGRTESGRAVAAGIYFVHLRAGGTVRTARLILLP